MGWICQIALRNDPVDVTSSGEEEATIVDEAAMVVLNPAPTYTNHNYDFLPATRLPGQNADRSADLANTVGMMKEV